MISQRIQTLREIAPLVYSWTTPDIPKYAGWEKIGFTEQASADARIAKQASQLSIGKNKQWARRALFTSETGGQFKDTDFHEYLRQQGVARETAPKRTEWHHLEVAPKTSLEYFNDFAGQDFPRLHDGGEIDYVLRPEQQAAVAQAVAAFEAGNAEVLWNAKPRFGKTLTTYDLMRAIDARRILIVTNRPAIANSWLDDFNRFIGHQTTFKFVSESPSLADRAPMTRKQWRAFSVNHLNDDPRIVEFVSLQDLKGSKYFGGPYDKLRHIAESDWDLLVIDEAHEGIDTTKTHVAFEQIRRQRTLHLSGTPFKALASGRFGSDQIFNWTYEDEQVACQQWQDESRDNPYAALPTLNLLTYQISRMISDRLTEGVAVEEENANIDYTFDLNEFFATKDNGFFEHEAEVLKFLDCLAANEKYPFSTPELRDEIRHSFWLLNRVASAKALEKLLKQHVVFRDYSVILAAGDGRSHDDTDPVAVGKSLEKVRTAIANAELSNDKTITLSVGQLTTGVTIPEWTAVIMLSGLNSPAQYMQAAFRAQNPCTFERAGSVFQKRNAYIFDFAPERTLTIFDAFANNLHPNPSGESDIRQENIRRLLNFFPVLGEDAEGRMVELDASEVLTFPQVFKAREIVRRGFLSNLLFANVAGIFRYSEHLKDILDKLPSAKQGKVKVGEPIEIPDPPPVVDSFGNVKILETVISAKVEELGEPVFSIERVPSVDSDTPVRTAATQIAKAVTDQAHEKRKELRDEYGLTAAQIERDVRRTELAVKGQIQRAYAEHNIANNHIEAALEKAATEAEAAAIQVQKGELNKMFKAGILSIVEQAIASIVPEVVVREEAKNERRRANQTMDEARAHLRGFARTIPMFLMAYGNRNTTLSNFDEIAPDGLFEEIAGISAAEFRLLRDGQEVTEVDGTVAKIPGLFDEVVFDQAIYEFLDKKQALADYFNDSQTENIFAYIPQQKTSLVFTPQRVVRMMVDTLEAEDPGIFTDPDRTFADLFSTAGLFLMELVRRLDSGLASVFPVQEERLRHILTSQVFEMSHNQILHRITIEAVSGGVPERKAWIEDSGHFSVGNLARMSSEERQQMTDDMLMRGN